MLGISVHPHYKLKQNRWFTNTGKSWIIETPFSRFVKRAAKLRLNRMWRHFSLDDAYTKISGVFCPAPGLEWHTNEAKGSIQCRSRSRSRIDAFASFTCQTADNCDKSFWYCSSMTQYVWFPPPGGGTPIWNRRGCSSEILNLTPKRDHLGVAQAFCDP